MTVDMCLFNVASGWRE